MAARLFSGLTFECIFIPFNMNIYSIGKNVNSFSMMVVVPMHIYSEKIVRFIEEIKLTLKLTLSKEFRLKVSGHRFYDKTAQYSYPLKVVVFNNKKMLGYFDPQFFELGFHECLMHTNKDQLLSVIRHELAHYIAYIEYGTGIQPHGPEFKTLCQKMGWGEEVYRATTCLDEGDQVTQVHENPIFRKVQKLMALSESSNSHEAELALVKSQELLIKHNLDMKFAYKEHEEEKIVLKRVLKEKRETAKMRCIGKILETFLVQTVFNRTATGTYLEILGDAVNVEIGEYVAAFLDAELPKYWEEVRKKGKVKGTIAKNSFFLGLAYGYCEKIKALRRSYNSQTHQALMVIEKKLSDATHLAYPRLFTSKRNGSFCPTSSSLGEQKGRALDIHPAVNHHKNSPSNLLITY